MHRDDLLALALRALSEDVALTDLATIVVDDVWDDATLVRGSRQWARAIAAVLLFEDWPERWPLAWDIDDQPQRFVSPSLRSPFRVETRPAAQETIRRFDDWAERLRKRRHR